MAGRVLAGDGGLVLKMHDLGLLAANLDEKSILKRCNTGSVTVSASHTCAHRNKLRVVPLGPPAQLPAPGAAPPSSAHGGVAAQWPA